MGGGARFRVGIALSAIGEGLREAARDFGGASLRCVCLPLSPAGSGHPHHRFITPSRGKGTALKIPLARPGDSPLALASPLPAPKGWDSAEPLHFDHQTQPFSAFRL